MLSGRKYICAALGVTLAAALPTLGAGWSEIWDAPNQFAGVRFAQEAGSASVERCHAVHRFAWRVETNLYWWSIVARQRSKLVLTKANIEECYDHYVKRDLASGDKTFSGLTVQNVDDITFSNAEEFLEYCDLPSNFFSCTPWFRLNHPSNDYGWVGTKKALDKMLSTYGDGMGGGSIRWERDGKGYYTGSVETAWLNQVADWDENEWSFYQTDDYPVYYRYVQSGRGTPTTWFWGERHNCFVGLYLGEWTDQRPWWYVQTNFAHSGHLYYRFAAKEDTTIFDFDNLVGGGGAIDEDAYYFAETFAEATTNRRYCTVLPTGASGENPFVQKWPSWESVGLTEFYSIYPADMLWIFHWDLPSTNGFKYF